LCTSPYRHHPIPICLFDLLPFSLEFLEIAHFELVFNISERRFNALQELKLCDLQISQIDLPAFVEMISTVSALSLDYVTFPLMQNNSNVFFGFDFFDKVEVFKYFF
jgi:hypothetical protein